MYNDELYHYGVKGMKWGVKHDNYNPKYSQDQRRRDRRIYGQRGVKRINKNMNLGDSISGARSIEADRINKARRRARVAGNVGSTVGSVGGAIGGFLGSKYVTNYISKSMPDVGYDPGVQMAVKLAVSGGASKVGQMLGRYGGQSVSMIMSGYSYDKYR